MKPWWQVAIPHKDIREGRFDPSVFAIDLGEVVYGQGVQEYRDLSGSSYKESHQRLVTCTDYTKDGVVQIDDGYFLEKIKPVKLFG